MANFEIFAKGPPFAFWPKLAILSTLQKNCHYSATSCCFIEIVVSIETRINSASIHTNQAKIRLALMILQPFKVGPRKWPILRFLQRVPPFAFWPKLAILSTLQKNCHYSATSCCFIEIVVSIETRINSASIHTNQAKIRLVLMILQPFKVGPRKWPILRFLQRVPPLHFGQNWPF